MTTRWRGFALLLTLLLLPVAPAIAEEPPSLAADVAAHKLPPLAQRLPRAPLVVAVDRADWTTGRYGGELRMLMAKDRDIRMMVVYGYARLVGYDEHLQLAPDILQSLDNVDNRVFTLHLRPGHRWSDGQPFTSEDFRYFWDDVANNKELSPFGLPRALLVDNHGPTFEVLDATTVRYTWDEPNPQFLAALAGPSPLFIYRPAHYLRQFHARYVGLAKANARAVAEGSRDWAGLYQKMDEQFRFDNPDLPTLEPWINTTPLPTTRFVLVRNPYFHRVDANGRQLPYIDRVIVNITDDKLIPARAGAGNVDLQTRYLRFDNYTFLKEGEQRNHYHVYLWEKAIGSQVALYPNLNVEDPVWRKLMRDVRFRRALSLGIDRHEVNEVVYFGLGKESANTILPRSPLVPTRIPHRVGAVRREARQRTARRDRPHEARRGRHSPASGRASDEPDRRYVGREHRGNGRARARARHVARARHRDVPAAVAARGVSQARVLRQVDDVGVVGPQQRHSDTRT